MKREPQQVRPDWRARLEEGGFHYHSIDEHGVDQSAHTDKFLYWREDVAYRFTEAQVETLYEATRELHAMAMDAAGDLVRRGNLGVLRLPPRAQALIEASWDRRDPHVYGRFDISWDGNGPPKMLEYNADTPTSLLESAVAQWTWKADVHPGADQFNSLHEALVERWREVARTQNVRRLHLACMYESREDVGNLEYMMDVALQAGLEAAMLDMADIGHAGDGSFVGLDGEPLDACFKLYPWEWMVQEENAARIPAAGTRWFEPAWKMALSNKALLAVLWERHAGHPNLLPAHFSAAPFDGGRCVKKPLLSREGANVTFLCAGQPQLATGGSYGAEGYVYQAYAPVAAFAAPEHTSVHGPQAAMHAVLGTWVVGDEAVGLCVREDVSPVTKDTSYFVPHYFE
jgi:glutathionylspermidine synthase